MSQPPAIEAKLKEITRLCKAHGLYWTQRGNNYHLYRNTGMRPAWLGMVTSVNDLYTKIKKAAGIETPKKAAPVRNVLQRARVSQ